MEYTINFHWDEEASVWTATSDDVPGLVLESGSFDALVERVKAAVPELLRINAALPAGSLRIIADRVQRLPANG